MASEADDRTDEELLRAFVDGRHDAFAILVKRHEDRMFAVAMRMTGNRADALDATQDAFIQAFRRAQSFRGESTFATWLYRIAANCSYDLLRARRRVPVPERDLPEQRATDPPVDEDVVLRRDVTAALAALPKDYREAVALHDLGGIPYDEIARITKVSIGTVKSRISRGRRRLAGLLEPHAGARTSKGHEE